MTPTATQLRTGREKTEGLGAPYQSNAEAPNVGTFTPSIRESSRSVNSAVEARFVQPGVQVVPVRGSRALEQARVHDVVVDGQRVGGICWARGAWRILSNAQARFTSRDDAVEALLIRRGRSQ